MSLGKIKVLHLIDSGGLYGAERMLLSLVQEQRTLGLDPIILSAGERSEPEKPFEREAKRLNLPIKIWRMKPGLNLQEARKIVQWANDRSIKLFHSHGYKFNILMTLPGIGKNVPIISTLHGYVQPPTFSKLWLYEIIDQFAIRRMDGVVLLGEAMKRKLPSTIADSSKTYIVRNGVSIDDIVAKSQARVPPHITEFISRHNPVLLGVGRLSPEKGFNYLVEAFADVRKRWPSAGLLIVGEGLERVALEDRIQQNKLNECVFMPGYSNNIPALMERTSLLVIPSLTEGLPITLLEAMATKLPIISSAVGEIPDILGQGECGEIINNIEIKNIAFAIDEVLSDYTRALKKADNAYDKICDNLSLSIMTENYNNIYRKVLE